MRTYIYYIYMYIYIYIFVCVCTHSIDPIAYHFIDIKNQPITCFLALTGIYHINPLSLYVTLGLTMSHYADTLVQNKRLKPHVCCGPIEGKNSFHISQRSKNCCRNGAMEKLPCIILHLGHAPSHLPI